MVIEDSRIPTVISVQHRRLGAAALRVHQHFGEADRVHHKLVDFDHSLHRVGVVLVVRIQIGDQRAGVGDDQSGQSSRSSFR